MVLLLCRVELSCRSHKPEAVYAAHQILNRHFVVPCKSYKPVSDLLKSLSPFLGEQCFPLKKERQGLLQRQEFGTGKLRPESEFRISP